MLSPGIEVRSHTAFVAMGLGGVRNAVLLRWFGILTVAMGALAALGDAGIPPGGLVNFLALPFWLIGASARSQPLAGDGGLSSSLLSGSVLVSTLRRIPGVCPDLRCVELGIALGGCFAVDSLRVLVVAVVP